MLKIRKATNKDREKVLSLHIQGLKESNSFSIDTSLDKDLEDIETSYQSPNALFVVAIQPNNKIVGMGAVRRIDSKTYEIKRMRVGSSYRRMGVAQLVLNSLFEFISSLPEVEYLSLDTSVEQIAAQKLYEKNGFKKEGKIMVSDIPSFLYKKKIK